MRLLGAIIAGGASRRFGSDKAQARLFGRSLFDHVYDVLEPQVETIVLCGRKSNRLRWLEDRPGPGLGPLGGINAALADAHARGFDMVLTVPIDVYPLPTDLVDRLAGGSATVLASQHLIGRWSAALSQSLDSHLTMGRFSLRSWIAASGAKRIEDGSLCLSNINTRAELRQIASIRRRRTYQP